jgi:AraC-like DNA-binding protein
MSAYTDKVVPLTSMSEQLPPSQLTGGSESWDQRIHHAEHWLRQQIDIEEGLSRTEQAIQYMMDAHGMVDIETIAQSLTVTRRHLEREFKKIIGLTPKYFSRIIQFNYIFEAMQRKDNAWVDVALNSGYFDQSHFIRNFKAFTGESPAQYGFDKKNLANFFLRK